MGRFEEIRLSARARRPSGRSGKGAAKVRSMAGSVRDGSGFGSLSLRQLFDPGFVCGSRVVRAGRRLADACKGRAPDERSIFLALERGASFAESLDVDGTRLAVHCAALHFDSPGAFDRLARFDGVDFSAAGRDGRGFLHWAGWTGNEAALAWWIGSGRDPMAFPAGVSPGTVALSHGMAGWAWDWAASAGAGRAPALLMEAVEGLGTECRESAGVAGLYLGWALGEWIDRGWSPSIGEVVRIEWIASGMEMSEDGSEAVGKLRSAAESSAMLAQLGASGLESSKGI